jgi:pyrroline-5-carboxylate reductase
MAQAILTEEGMAEALEHKLLISILAGTRISQLVSWVPSTTRVVRAMPNTPCKVSNTLTDTFTAFQSADDSPPWLARFARV